MHGFLYAAGHFAYLRRWLVCTVWLIVTVGAVSIASLSAQPLSRAFDIPDMPSVATREETDVHFPPSIGEPVLVGKVVVQVPEGSTLDDAASQDTLRRMIAELQADPALNDSFEIASPQQSADKLRSRMYEEKSKLGYPASMIEGDFRAASPVNSRKDTGIFELNYPPGADLKQARKILDSYDAPEFQVAYYGDAFTGDDTLSMSSELLGFAVAALVLMATFGSLLAAGMPLITAFIGVILGLSGVMIASHFTSAINFLTPSLATMIGIAVGVDYALFIAARFRSELVRQIGNNLTPDQLRSGMKLLSKEQRAHAMGIATSTAGRSVVFAGLTVFIALASLTVIGIPFLTALAHAAAATVALAVLVALTLLPALFGALGKRAFAGRVPFFKAPDPEDEQPTLGLSWIRLIRAYPLRFLAPSVLLLLACAIPAVGMQLAMPTDSSTPLHTPTRRAADMVESGFGPGRDFPMLALVDASMLPEKERKQALLSTAQSIKKVEGVAHVQPTRATSNLAAVELLITTQYSATDHRAAQTLDRLRAQEASTSVRYGITGMTPVFVDLSQRLSDALLPYISLVLVLAFLTLIAVFRSLWVPLIATAGFLLSIAATFGITVALFQEGWFGLVDDPQPLISFLPIILIGLVFGLAMDYQVFLVSRMREGWEAGKSAADAVSNGFKHSARVVTSAALIMIAVFASFMFHDAVFIKTMGFALAVAVFFDAFIVRMTIIPALMFLLGERAWRLPLAAQEARPPQLKVENAHQDEHHSHKVPSKS
ncbi:MMPL family transporter [Corynebacterium sp. H128]|uniref:MMPL family transporter n=1 Tax=Corynebacterium sp. H128 TaxID=3133427 RepID=UPI0030B5F06F